jgi:hypothetical protein
VPSVVYLLHVDLLFADGLDAFEADLMFPQIAEIIVDQEPLSPPVLSPPVFPGLLQAPPMN